MENGSGAARAPKARHKEKDAQKTGRKRGRETRTGRLRKPESTERSGTG